VQLKDNPHAMDWPLTFGHSMAVPCLSDTPQSKVIAVPYLEPPVDGKEDKRYAIPATQDFSKLLLPAVTSGLGSIANQFYFPPQPYTHDKIINQTASTEKAATRTVANSMMIPTLILRVGNFLRESIWCGDILFSVSIEKRSFVWELLGLKGFYRTELPFDSINGIDIELSPTGSAILLLKLKQKPNTYKCVLTPHVTPVWEVTTDETTEQISCFEHQELHFIKAALSNVLEKLFSFEKKLQNLAAKGLKGCDMFSTFAGWTD